MVYLQCERWETPSLPSPGEGVDSAAELDTPDPAIVEAGTTSKGSKGKRENQSD